MGEESLMPDSRLLSSSRSAIEGESLTWSGEVSWHV